MKISNLSMNLENSTKKFQKIQNWDTTQKSFYSQNERTQATTKNWASLGIWIWYFLLYTSCSFQAPLPPIWNHKSNFAAKCEFMAKSGICDNFPQNVNLWQSPEQTIERAICRCRRSIFLLGIFGKFIQTFAYTATFWNSHINLKLNFL